VDLSTDRLRIRPWRADEAPRLLDILSRIEVVKWLGDGEPVLMKDLEEARARIERFAARSAEPPLGVWAIERRSDGLALGTVLLLTLPEAEHGEVEIGWHLHPDSWGHGYASEAARAVLGHAFAAGLPEVLAVTHLDNWPSQGVARKIGMTDQGVVEKWYDDPSRLFRITAEEWAAAAAPAGGLSGTS
jgi:RimJ/RimL family protein N-acetyltransferase